MLNQTNKVKNHKVRIRIKLITITLILIALSLIGCSSDKSSADASDETQETTVISEKDSSEQAGESLGTKEKTTEKYNEIKLDMTLEQVKKTLGGNGQEILTLKDKDWETTMFKWSGAERTSIAAMFRDGILTAKQLRYNEDLDNSKSNLKEIKEKLWKDMADNEITHEQISKMTGSEGLLYSQRKFPSSGGKVYSMRMWKNNDGFLFAYYIDGVLAETY